MTNVEWTVERSDGVAFVSVVVSSTRGRLVRVRPRVEDDVLPPRSRGIPESGWSDGEVTASVSPDRPLAVGFATRGAVDEPPVSVTPVDGEPETSATDLLHRLGDPRPPAWAVPSVDVPDVAGSKACVAGKTDGRMSQEDATTNPPASVEAWLADVTARIEQVKALSEASSVGKAADRLDEHGGLAGVDALLATVEADVASMRSVARRLETMADRGEQARDDVPVASFRRLS